MRDERADESRPRDDGSLIGGELEVTVGNVAGASLHVRFPEALGHLQRVEDDVHAGTIAAGWTRIAVLTKSQRAGLRFWLLTPAREESSIELGPFFVRGQFSQSKVDGERAASEAWNAFRTR